MGPLLFRRDILFHLSASLSGCCVSCCRGVAELLFPRPGSHEDKADGEEALAASRRPQTQTVTWKDQEVLVVEPANLAAKHATRAAKEGSHRSSQAAAASRAQTSPPPARRSALKTKRKRASESEPEAAASKESKLQSQSAGSAEENAAQVPEAVAGAVGVAEASEEPGTTEREEAEKKAADLPDPEIKGPECQRQREEDPEEQEELQDEGEEEEENEEEEGEEEEEEKEQIADEKEQEGGQDEEARKGKKGAASKEVAASKALSASNEAAAAHRVAPKKEQEEAGGENEEKEKQRNGGQNSSAAGQQDSTSSTATPSASPAAVSEKTPSPLNSKVGARLVCGQDAESLVEKGLLAKARGGNAYVTPIKVGRESSITSMQSPSPLSGMPMSGSGMAAGAKQPLEPSFSDTASLSGRRGIGRTPGEEITHLLHQALLACNRNATVVQDASSLMSKVQVGDVIEAVLTANDMAELEAMIEKVRKSSDQTKLLSGGMSKSATHLSTHTQNLKRKAEREQNKKKRLEEAQELQAFRMRAKDAAKRVKEQATTCPTVFQHAHVTLLAAGAVTEFQVVTGEVAKGFDVDVPTIFKNVPVIETWSKEPKLQVTFGAFGGKYKKASGFQETARAQMPIYSREGKEESAELIKHISERMKEENRADEPHAFTKMLDTQWLFGYDPKLAAIAATPNSMAMLKVLVHGSLRWLVFESSSLVAHLRSITGKEQISLDEVPDLLGSWTVEDLQTAAHVSGVKMYCCSQDPLDAVWIPCGYVCLEQAMKGVLLYGMRATYLVKSEAACLNYETMIGLSAAAKKSTEKMKEALQLMEPSKS